MGTKGRLEGGKPYEIELAADAANVDETSLASFWLMVSPPDPPADHDWVAAGGVAVQKGIAPARNLGRILEIDVHPPDAGKFTLTVKQNQAVVTTETLTGDTRWIFGLK